MEDNFEFNKQYGCFQVARSLFHDELWLMKPAWWIKAWIYIIGKANHTDYNEKIRRGDLFTTYHQIYNDCNLAFEGVQENAIDNLIRFLKDTQKCTTRKTTRGFIITVLNYDVYQTISNFKNGTGNVIKTTPKRYRNDRINNNGKKERQEEVALPPDSSFFPGEEENTEGTTDGALQKPSIPEQKNAVVDNLEKLGNEASLKTLAEEWNIITDDLRFSFGNFSNWVQSKHPKISDYKERFHRWINEDVEREKVRKRQTWEEKMAKEGVPII